MQYAYSIADLVISRAGATTIAELQKFCIPAILIPYPFAYAHQLNNARVLEDLGAALIIREEPLIAEKLVGKLFEFLASPQKLAVMRQAYAKNQVFDAVKLLTNAVLCLN
jgi:UDP-N-acetylglucosamine--N-acetylmuramyl-(pentapeptide) pyrophosphoryl-undecaprenol N-acetylglucosamine transferase